MIAIRRWIAFPTEVLKLLTEAVALFTAIHAAITDRLEAAADELEEANRKLKNARQSEERTRRLVRSSIAGANGSDDQGLVDEEGGDPQQMRLQPTGGVAPRRPPASPAEWEEQMIADFQARGG